MRYLKALLFGILFAIGGVAFYAFVLQKMCWTPASYCSAYNFLAVLITAYGNFVMQFVRPECVAGGPDDCIAQALSIMFLTLLALGVASGLFIFRERDK